MKREKDHRAQPVGVIQVKIDSSNNSNARSALKQLRSERETSDGVGMYLEIGLKIYQRMPYFVFWVNIFIQIYFGGWVVMRGMVAEN